jgi:hypothetical protein
MAISMVMSQLERQGLLLVPEYQCTLCTQAGWLELVYDDVCGKQANRVLYAGESSETGSKEVMHNKPGREVLQYSERARWVD